MSSTPFYLNEIQEGFNAGKSLVPFVGAGLSVDAGLPTIVELTLFLKLCIGKALSKENWKPIVNPWPVLKGNWKTQADTYWNALVQKVVEDLNNRSRTPTNSSDAQQAFGALADWRLALQFLARIRPGDQKDQKLLLGAIDPHVIDSFFKHITQNKSPAMGHRMLAYFAESLRAPVTLTLNFDDLLEQAYRQASLNPQLFEVHQKAAIPPWSALGGQHSIVKLHGGKYGLRADLSLDEDPTEEDKRNFRGYLIRKDWGEHENHEKPKALADLLIVGISGSDSRVVQLVSDALNKIDELHVYWYCFSDKAQTDLQKLFPIHFRVAPAGPGVHPVRHPHAGTWLWEIYQRIMRCVPPGGLEFPTTWQMPYPPAIDDAETATLELQMKQAESWVDTGDDRLELWSPDDPDQEFGVSCIGWKLFQFCRGRRYRCIWLDGEDLQNEVDFRFRFYQAVCSALGQQHAEPTLDLAANNEDFCKELEDKLSQSGSPWILFVNLRGSLGYAANMFSFLEYKRAQATTTQRSAWNLDTREAVSSVCREVQSSCSHLRIVALIRGDEFSQIGTKAATRIPFNKPQQRKWADQRVDSVKTLLNKIPNPIASKVLQAVTLFPQVRHISALVSRGMSQRDQTLTSVWTEVEVAIQILVGKTIVRQKPGGFLWMHWLVREKLRALISPDENPKERAVLHVSLADWCMTFFGATKDPVSVFQAVFHRCRAAELFYKLVDGVNDTTAMKEIEEAFIQFRSALLEAENHLESARGNVAAWGAYLDAQRCLDGFTEFLRYINNNIRSKGLITRNRNLRCILPLEAKALTYKIWFTRDLGNLLEVNKACDALGVFLEDNKQLFVEKGIELDPLSWSLTLELERAILLISQRNYQAANQALCTFLSRLGYQITDVNEVDGCGDEDLRRGIYRWIDSQEDQGRFVKRRFALFAFRRLAEVSLLQQELTQLLATNTPKTSEMPPDEPHGERADKFYYLGRMIPRFIAEDEYSQLAVERSRLHSIRAGILAIKKDWQGVRRFINEALMAAANVPESEASIAQSVIDLRQIYCKLMEIFALASIDKCLRAMRSVSKLDAPTPMDQTDTMKAEALLEDIKLILDRIETRMNIGRKTLFWWMTLQRYRMTWIQCRELLRASRRLQNSASTLPNTDSDRDAEMARGILRTTIRRVHYDAFQLARICYAGLIIARASPTHLEAAWRMDLKAALYKLDQIRLQVVVGNQKDSDVELFLDNVTKELLLFCDSCEVDMLATITR